MIYINTFTYIEVFMIYDMYIIYMIVTALTWAVLRECREEKSGNLRPRSPTRGTCAETHTRTVCRRAICGSC